jgi:hypothetical protein
MQTSESISFLQMTQFNAENRSLYSVHAAIPSNHFVMVFASLAVIPKDPNFLLQLAPIGNDGACLAECAKILPRIEAKATYVSEGADPSPFIFRPVGLRCVFDNEQSMRARKLKNWIHIRRLAEKMDGNNRLGFPRYGAL